MMDPSQSPTQFNDDRDYPEDNYQQFWDSPTDLTAQQETLEPTQPSGLEFDATGRPRGPYSSEKSQAQPYSGYETQLSADNAPNSLRDDDTGAVNFSSMPLPESEGSLVKTRDYLNSRKVSLDYGHHETADECRTAGSQNVVSPGLHDHEPTSDGFQLNPETPAPHNPFAGIQSKGAILDTSQMFQQTQATSALRPLFNNSPTSSRPSPDLRAPNTISPNTGLYRTPMGAGASSPLKGRYMSRNTQAASSPLITSPAHGLSSAIRPRSDPRPSSKDDEPVVPESPLRRQRAHPRPRRHSIQDTTVTKRHLSQVEEEDDTRGLCVIDAISSSPNRLDADQDLGGSTPPEEQHCSKTETDRSSWKTGHVNVCRSEAVLPRPTRPAHSNKTSLYKSAAYIAQCHGDTAGDDDAIASEEESDKNQWREVIVEDSQKSLRRRGKKTPSSSAAQTTDSHSRRENSRVKETPVISHKDDSNLRSSERVPETSPVLRPIADIINGASGTTASEGLSIPSLSAGDLGTQGDSTENPNPTASNPDDYPDTEQAQDIPPSSDAPLARPTRTKFNWRKPKKQSSETPKREDRPSHDSIANVPKPTGSHIPGKGTKTPPSSTASSLTELTQTPEVDAKVTPSTQERPSSVTLKSAKARDTPSVGKKAPLPSHESPMLHSDAPRQARRARKPAVIESDSTDELARSAISTPADAMPSSPPVTSTNRVQGDKKKAVFRNGHQRASLVSTRGSSESCEQSVVHDTRHLFQGMAFAISFQSRRKDESDRHYHQRTKESENIANSIIHHGGHILATGFDELFEVPSPQALASANPTPTSTPTRSQQHTTLKLKDSSRCFGFAALIADGHSRKVKYMQALALGLPCISDRWISMCIKKGDVIAWDTYLLCAGNSSILGDAIRSRHLEPYPALQSKFSNVIKDRVKLMEGQSILLVLKKTQRKKEEQKKAYLFLAQVLGATLGRAETIPEARLKMREKENSGEPYDWVYFEGDDVEEGLFGQESLNKSTKTKPARRSKKRKRQSAALDEGESELATEDGPPPKRVKALRDEIVVQSLILGRLVEDEEMELCKAP
ncbi:hypothetical protein MKZ38_000634 [Zalerion maritima]|uniref:BRCT domain-containing protein n=1 Tax=Zalerion maritima TaxID=339359 RepID=A0AAD5WRY3_9PEZI|nr:hypothetical protein MKZ38_000634 [Zalerion maritima]